MRRSDDVRSSGDSGYNPGYARAAERILEFIADRGLRPGDRLPAEQDLGRELGFSRTVTREAIKVLSAVGRVSAHRGRGIFVDDQPSILGAGVSNGYLPLDLADVAMLFEFRRMLESDAARLAAERASPAEVRAVENAAGRWRDAAADDDYDAMGAADEEFHQAVANAARNKFVAAALSTARRVQAQSTVIGVGRSMDQQEKEATDAEHHTLASAIRDGDGDAAAACAVAHIERTSDLYHKEIQRRVFG